MIWAPFVLALLLGVIVSAGLYVAYLWPSVEPEEPDEESDEEPAPAIETRAAAEPVADTAEANAAATPVRGEAAAT